jgi:hypothetical protein
MEVVSLSNWRGGGIGWSLRVTRGGSGRHWSRRARTAAIARASSLVLEGAGFFIGNAQNALVDGERHKSEVATIRASDPSALGQGT